MTWPACCGRSANSTPPILSLLEARLKALAEPDNPWHALASEDLALLDLRQGHTAAAKVTLRRLASDVSLPQDLRGRASLLLNRLGG